jgi:hypothetical protein
MIAQTLRGMRGDASEVSNIFLALGKERGTSSIDQISQTLLVPLGANKARNQRRSRGSALDFWILSCLQGRPSRSTSEGDDSDRLAPALMLVAQRLLLSTSCFSHLDPNLATGWPIY